MNEAYLSLGGNLGNCIETFAKALKLLERQAIRVLEKSSIYTTEPWEMQNAPDFYNRCIQIRTNHSSNELMDIILGIEKELGRERSEGDSYESRTIDIDILFFNSETIDTPVLKVPHPRLHLRRFVLEPLSEIAPSFIHPALQKEITELLEICEDKCRTKKIAHAF